MPTSYIKSLSFGKKYPELDWVKNLEPLGLDWEKLS